MFTAACELAGGQFIMLFIMYKSSISHTLPKISHHYAKVHMWTPKLDQILSTSSCHTAGQVSLLLPLWLTKYLNCLDIVSKEQLVGFLEMTKVYMWFHMFVSHNSRKSEKVGMSWKTKHQITVCWVCAAFIQSVVKLLTGTVYFKLLCQNLHIHFYYC